MSCSKFVVLFRVKRSLAAATSTATAQETALDSEQACCILHPEQPTYGIKLIAEGIRSCTGPTLGVTSASTALSRK